ncbi:hypothetical protein Tco_0563797 [Tanacetum coccineum]
MVYDSVNSVPMWSIRSIDEDIDVYRMYGNNENLFSMKIYYAGKFTPQPGRAYVNGTFSYVDVCDIDEFSVHELNDLVQKLGYSAKVKLYYHFRKPDGDLDTCMHALGNDHDVRKLAEYVRLGNKMIQEIEDDAMPEMKVIKLRPRKPVKGQYSKKLMLEWTGEPNVGAVDQGQASQVTKEIGESNNDFDPFLDLDTLDDADREISESIGKGKGGLETVEEDEIVIGGGNETKTNDVTDVEEGSDSKEGSDNESSDGTDSDELVDKENPVEHVHVDMDTFDKSNADKLDAKDRQGEFNSNKEIDVDLDAIDNEEFESASHEHGLERVRQRKLKQLRKQNKPKHGDVHKYYFYVGQEFVSGDKVPIKAIQDQLQKKYQVEVSRMKSFRAKSKAVDQVRGDYTSQYHILRIYVMKLKASNPNTTVRIGVESEADHTCPTRVFKRIYIYLGAVKAGFKPCIRDSFGFDGAFMKGPFPGQLLTAVGIDSNNGIYLLASKCKSEIIQGDLIV